MLTPCRAGSSSRIWIQRLFARLLHSDGWIHAFPSVPIRIPLLSLSSARWVFGRQINRTDTATAIGDTAFSAGLGWQQGEHHWNMTLTGVAPTGEYNESSLAIMGLNRPAVDLKGAYTFLSLETGIEATGALGFTFNAMNTATDYQTGIEMHFEWELAEHLPSASRPASAAICISS
jgi:hypothetical protein